MKIHTIASVLGLAAVASAEIFLHETFADGNAWTERWTPSKHKEDLGQLKLSAGKFFADENKSVGLQTTEDYRFYAVSAPITPFSNKGKDLVIQYSVKNEQSIDCGGGYMKVYKKAHKTLILPMIFLLLTPVLPRSSSRNWTLSTLLVIASITSCLA